MNNKFSQKSQDGKRRGKQKIFLLVLGIVFFAQLPALAQLAVLREKVSINQKQATALTIIELLDKQSSYSFTYAQEKMSAIVTRPFKVEGITLGEALQLLQKQYGLQFAVRDGNISVKPGMVTEKPSSAPAPVSPGHIGGKIVDEENGQPVEHVNVIVNGQAAITGPDGSFSMVLPDGVYEAEVSLVGYQKKIVTDVQVKKGQGFTLNVTLKREKGQLAGFTVRTSAHKESTNALYARQKNEAGISNGISQEQVAALPDKNVGETLKRISGVSTNDNRRVVVRGIAERYNVAMMDGAILPSTDVQVRDFEFDLVPSNLIDNITVYKTSTPDMSFGFGGGMVQISTMAVPENNFITLNAGVKYIDGSTGKDFLGYARGKHDYLAFDDGSRDHFPNDLMLFSNSNYDPRNPNVAPQPGVPAITPAMVAAQNKKIGGFERLGTRTYQAMPGQNYQFSIGRTYQLKKNRLGFVGSLSYRNEQAIDKVSQFERGEWEKTGGGGSYDGVTGEELLPTYANQYNFNTTWGALFNIGWSTRNHKITVRNFYSRVFNNQFSRIVGYGNDIGYEQNPAIREYDRPKFINLLQNRINGEHTFGAFRFDWNVSRNNLDNLEKDAVEAWLAPTKTLNGTVYNVIPSGITNPGSGTFNRAQYHYTETNTIAEGALSYHFNLFGQKQVAKSGYQYMRRHGTYDWIILPIGSVLASNSVYVPVQEWGQFLDFNDTQRDLLYYPGSFSRNGYEGQNTNQAWYAMFDNRFNSWIRFVWGMRGEYYKYERIRSGANDLVISTLIDQGEKIRYVDPATGKIVTPFADAEAEEKTWRYLPSASLTVTPVKNLNVRAAYSQSVVRPALIENSRMIRFDPAIGAYRRNEGVLSTLIDHYDLRLEWYPKPGEVISVGYFYKYFDKPVELYRARLDASMRTYVITQNSDWAKVNGWEFDMRKSLSFIRPGWKFLNDFYLSGNFTYQSSEVQSSVYQGKSMNSDIDGNGYEYRVKVLQRDKRPLFGQVPILYNIGLQYGGDRLGINVAWNHMGYKTFTTGLTPDIVEYERPRNQLDVQVSYKLLKNKKLAVRLNMSNLLNSPYRFYINSIDTYKLLDKWKGLPASAITATDWADIYEWNYGFSNKYEEGHYETSADGKTKTRIGDKNTFTRKVGAAFSLNISYTF